jgi:L-aminopeptidase/D-esterase-like protein
MSAEAPGTASTGAPPSLPDGFAVGHWTEREAGTGCTVIIPPPGTRGGSDVRGGGPGTRELEVMGPLSTAEEATAVVLAGGSAFGLATADGASRWLEEHGRGYETPGGRVPLVAAAVIYDLVGRRSDVRPGADAGYAACEAATGGVPERGAVGAGTGAAVGKLLGRERGVAAGVGYAAAVTGAGETVAAVSVVNAVGDVIAQDGSVLAGPAGPDGETLRTATLVAELERAPDWREVPEQNTTLVCVCTDAALPKPGCAVVARMASAGIARAVDPVFTPVDGDVAFCLASGGGEPRPYGALLVGTVAATVTAAAVRDSVARRPIDRSE